MDLAEIQRHAYETAHTKGLHDHLRSLSLRDQTLIRLALVHTEVSEAAQEAKRHGITATSRVRIGEELADTLIRVVDLAACLEIDLDAAVQTILARNTQRPMFYGTPQQQKDDDAT